MIYTVYILYSPSHQKIYIGYTSNLLNRMLSHNELGKDWTSNFRPWTVIYTEYFSVKKEARQRELQLKQANKRKRIHQLIQTVFQLHGFISAP